MLTRRDSARSGGGRSYEAVSIDDADEHDSAISDDGDSDDARLLSSPARSTKIEEVDLTFDAGGGGGGGGGGKSPLAHPLSSTTESGGAGPCISVKVMAPPKFIKPAELRLAAQATVKELRSALMEFLSVPSEGKRLRVSSRSLSLSFSLSPPSLPDDCTQLLLSLSPHSRS